MRERPSKEIRLIKYFTHHLGTTKHKVLVLFYCVKFALKLIARGIKHDNSKYGKKEAKYFIPEIHLLKTLDYGSDKYKESLARIGPGIEHHYETNRHHPEHFDGGINDMGLIDLIEMFMDWKAATKRTKNGDLTKSIEHNAQRFSIGRRLANIMKNS